MNYYLLLGFIIIAGIGAALQPAINAKLGMTIGQLEAALVNFTVGLTVLLILLPFLGKGRIADVIHVPWYYLLGGTFGLLIVLGMIFGVPVMGLTFYLSVIIATQLTVSVVLDHYGFMGAPVIPVTPLRIIGIILLIAGSRLVMVK